MFDDVAIILRQICNGAMTIGAVWLLVVFVCYVLRARKDNPGEWYKDIAVQGAIATAVLLTGHTVRAAIGWGQFIFMQLEWDSSAWANSHVAFLVATALIVAGKLLMTYTFSHDELKKWNTIALAVICVTVPAAIAVTITWIV